MAGKLYDIDNCSSSDFFSHDDSCSATKKTLIQFLDEGDSSQEETKAKLTISKNEPQQTKQGVTNSQKSERQSPISYPSKQKKIDSTKTARADEGLEAIQKRICMNILQGNFIEINKSLPIVTYIKSLQLAATIAGLQGLSEPQTDALGECIKWLDCAAQEKAPKDCTSLKVLAEKFGIKYVFDPSENEYKMTSPPEYKKIVCFFDAVQRISCEHLRIYEHFSTRYAKNVVWITSSLGLSAIIEVAAGRGQQAACFKAIKRPQVETTDPIIDDTHYSSLKINNKDALETINQREKSAPGKTLYLASHPVKNMWVDLLTRTTIPFIMLTVGPDVSPFFQKASSTLKTRSAHGLINLNLQHYSELHEADLVQLVFLNIPEKEVSEMIDKLALKYRDGHKLIYY